MIVSKGPVLPKYPRPMKVILTLQISEAAILAGSVWKI